MKQIITAAIALTLVPSPALPVDKDPARANVLVIGIPRENITSNYYYDGLIAEKISIPVDSLAGFFNRAIVSRLPDAGAGPARFICRGNHPRDRALAAGLRYEGEEENIRVDLSRVSRDALARLLDDFNADFLLLVNQYYMKQETEPFPYLYHIIHYELYDRDKTTRYRGVASFDTPDLMPAPRLDKYYKKIASKIVSRVNRAISES